MQNIPISAQSLPDIIAFCRDHGWHGAWSPETISLLLTQLISSNELIFDVHESDRRIAVGVVLDKVTNKINHADFFVMAMVKGADEEAVVEHLLACAKRKLPAAFQTMRVCFSDAFAGTDLVIQRHQLQPFYETYEMERVNDGKDFRPDPRFILAAEADETALHQAIHECFKDNIDIGFSPFEEWQRYRRENPPLTWILKQDDAVAAFLDLMLPGADDDTAEIRLIGTMPELRRQGIGKALLQTALTALVERQVPKTKLYVTVTNPSALNLYRAMGFEKTSRYISRLWYR